MICQEVGPQSGPVRSENIDPSAESRPNDFFDESYFDSLSSGLNAELTTREVRWIAEHCGAPPGAALLDLGCGEGRHALALSALGYRTVGVDASAEAIHRAQIASRAQGADATFVHGTASKYRPELGAFDGVVSWQTSIGIVGPESNDADTLANAFRSLRPGGRLILEFTSATWLLRNFSERAWRRLPNGREVVEERRYCGRTGVISTHSRIIDGEHVGRSRQLSIRAYTAPELVNLVEAAGHNVVELAGDLDGRPYDLDSRRVLLIAERPRR